jgi:multidrug efflux pump subunit AcrB
MALLGLVALSGVVVNDSIVLVDFVNKGRQRGMQLKDAIFRAGQLRLRPVLLTSVTTICGLGPMAYGLWGGDPFLRPMAMALIWGLLFATILTLLTIPVIYTIVDDVNGKLRSISGMRRKQESLEASD